MKAGDDFGDYRVIRRLGTGGMGEVWLLEGKSGRRVAAKILDPAMSADRAARRRFLREAQLALGVKHPNIVEVYDVGEDPDTGLCYILMEYVPGGTLAECLAARGRLSVGEAVAVVRAMAQVLELAHRRGIVHRDIKPANIMFAADGTPKLADLGIARGGLAAETTTVTQAGAVIGTPAYMAPEQMIDAHAVDSRADIYSLGVVFFEMLAGERPHKDDTVVQLMAKALMGEPLQDIRKLRPGVPAPLARLLSMMVAPDKEKRLSAPGEIVRALDVIEGGGSCAEGGRPFCAFARALSRLAGRAVSRLREGPAARTARVSVAAVLVGTIAAGVFPLLREKPPASPAEPSVSTGERMPRSPDPPVEITRAAPTKREATAVCEAVPAATNAVPPVAAPPPVAVTAVCEAIPPATNAAPPVAVPKPVAAAANGAEDVSVGIVCAIPPTNAPAAAVSTAASANRPAVRRKKRTPAAVPAAKTSADVLIALKTTTLAKFEISPGRSISEVVDGIRAALNPRVGFTFLCAGDKPSAGYTLRMENVQAWKALDRLCQASGIRFEIRDKTVCLLPVDADVRKKSVVPAASASRFRPSEIRRMQDSDGGIAMRRTVEKLFRGWRLSRRQLGKDLFSTRRTRGWDDLPPGYVAEYRGRADVLRTRGGGDLLEYVFATPVAPDRMLHFWVCGDPDVGILVKADGVVLCDCGAVGGAGWSPYDVDLSSRAGKRPTLTISVRGRSDDACVLHWHELSVR